MKDDDYEGYDPKTRAYAGEKGREQMKGSGREKDRWIAACWRSLCSRYPPYDQYKQAMEEQCNHDWCKGVVDVLNRVLGPR